MLGCFGWVGGGFLCPGLGVVPVVRFARCDVWALRVGICVVGFVVCRGYSSRFVGAMS